MIKEMTGPTIEMSQSIVDEAIKILKEKKQEDFTKEDLIILKTAYKLCKLAKGLKR